MWAFLASVTVALLFGLLVYFLLGRLEKWLEVHGVDAKEALIEPTLIEKLAIDEASPYAQITKKNVAVKPSVAREQRRKAMDANGEAEPKSTTVDATVSGTVGPVEPRPRQAQPKKKQSRAQRKKKR